MSALHTEWSASFLEEQRARVETDAYWQRVVAVSLGASGNEQSSGEKDSGSGQSGNADG